MYRLGKRQRHYVQQYVDRITEILQASLSQETWRDEQQKCGDCAENNWAIWRCLDCTFARPVCRRCMRHDHRHSPLHRIECWTGHYFRRAALWEVGNYMLITHHCGQPLCSGLQWQVNAGASQNGENLVDPMASRPTADALDNTYVRVIHTNGIHHLAMLTCNCHGAENITLDLVAARMLPASFKRIRTLFSVEVMDYFRLCNLELKASAYQFNQLLRRLTSTSNGEVINIYNEFRRMSRLWRWTKKLKWAGYGHKKEDPLKPPPGSLANFCPTCPQPGVNLPEDWMDDKNRFVYRLVVDADGNFKADHVRSKTDHDVWLLDGGGMFPNRNEYFTFLAKAIEMFTVTPCENTFRAIANALQASNACDLTGVFAVICARHGCYIPNALVDLFKGEQQKNADFCILRALRILNIDPRQGLLIIYDIVCQWIVHLMRRIGDQLPEGLDIDRAIDLFHVHAHKDQCFWRFSTSLIPGAGAVAGVMLESNWSSLNAISPTARTATLPHRAEILDDHACDSNHKKLVAMTEVLRAKFFDATNMVAQADKYYLEIAAAVPQDSLHSWNRDIVNVERQRLKNVSVMDIYAAKLPDRLSVDEEVEKTPASNRNATAIEQWIEYAMVVEEKQLELQDRVRRLGGHPHEDDQQIIERQRQTLGPMLVKMRQLHEAAGVLETAPTIDMPEGEENQFDETYEAVDSIEDPNNPEPTPPPVIATATVVVERQVIKLPSNGSTVGNGKEVELRLRKTQASSQIHRLRDIIAELSFQYSHVMRANVRKSCRTQAQKKARALHHTMVLHARVYRRCRSRLVALQCDNDFLSRFPVLLKDHLKASTAILRPNTPGSSSLDLPWIWRTGRCVRPSPFNSSFSHQLILVKRIHWLRARAQKDRWHEELTMVKYEMQWTVKYFLHKQRLWQDAVQVADISRGAAAYATRQAAYWAKFADTADRTFRVTTPHYVTQL
ncbi:hypothetical protein GALMADRAFT_79915 [Galerina marginata CBS 339.88]|uniref:CxC2-like cysteine cluster KDZ transposase-associated domain-containing protein n=1 Tax=Galerina marginata (strain CBS 339.88) TaxID=685588 RepID=A0A067SBQ2_GALM3|nr:hypothetical protein GALMADRAFT_79915 [Galerina marginata CBS 339.88]